MPASDQIEVGKPSRCVMLRIRFDRFFFLHGNPALSRLT